MKYVLLIIISLVLFSCKTNTAISLKENIPFSGEQLVVIGIPINNKIEYFLIDTGSSISYIAIEFLNNERCFKISEDEMTFAGINNNVNYKTAKVKVTIFNESYWFNTVSLYAINRVIKKPIIGIIGSDFLRRNKLIIDYNKRIIYQSKN